MRKYIKYLIIILILFMCTNVNAKTYGLVDSIEECHYDACFTELDDILTDGEDEANVSISFESTKTDFKINSHEFNGIVLFSFNNQKEYSIDGDGSTLKTNQHFVFRSNKGNFYNLSNINFISSPTSICGLKVSIYKNNYDGALSGLRLVRDYIGVALSNPKSLDNISSTIVGESENTITALYIVSDHFLDDNKQPIYHDIEINNVSTSNSSTVGIVLMGGKYNLNNFNSDSDISVHSLFRSLVDINNTTIRSLISSDKATINVNSNNKWYQNQKVYFLNMIIGTDNTILSDEMLNYIKENKTFNYILTDQGTINIKDFKEEKVDFKNKKDIKISDLFSYFGNVNLNEEDWTSSNPDVATIEEGTIKIKSIGETILTTTPKNTQTVLEYKLIVSEEMINPKTNNNIIILVSLLVLLLTLVLLFMRNKEEF